MTMNDQDLRTALEAECETAWRAYRIGTPENRGPGWNDPTPSSAWDAAWKACLDAVLRAAPPRPDHAGGVEDRDEVLFAFHRYAKDLDPAEVTWWTRHFPQYATDICEHAVELIDMRFRVEASPAQAPDKAAEREGVFWQTLKIDDPDDEGLADALQVPTRQITVQWCGNACDPTIGWVRNDDGKTCAPTSSRINAACRAIQALAPKPTGTEAGRGVGAETSENLRHILTGVNKLLDGNATIETPEEHVNWLCWGLEGLQSRVAHAISVHAATPTPPTPDSTAQGDGTSQEGGR